jgi:signal peptide peptidase SppA
MSNLFARKLSKLCGKIVLADADSTSEMLQNVDTIARLFDESKTVLAMDDDDGWSLSENQMYYQKDGVAAITVHGMLLNRCTGSYGFVTGYQYVRQALNTALSDTSVKGIVFDIDSPGGMYQGAFELADYIASRKGEKPTKAIVNSEACSAAYILACTADSISATPSSTVGSIGVLMVHKDATESNRQAGVKYTIIRAGKHKALGSPIEPLSDEFKSELQANVDSGYDMFTKKVASLRGIEESAILALDSRSVSSDKAKVIGLIDMIEDEDEAVTSFITAITNPDHEEPKMEQTQDVDTGAIVAAERSRIKAIMQSEDAVGRETLAAKLAFDTDMEPAMAVDLMKASPKVEVKPIETKASDDTGKDFNDAMLKTGNPEVHADESGDEPEESMAVQILKAQTQATGRVFN